MAHYVSQKTLNLGIFAFFLGLLFSISYFILYIPSVSAQEIPYDVGDIDIEITPPTPGPFEEVKLRAQSFTLNLDTLPVSWVVNGQVLLSGIGEKDLSVTTGANGSITSIDIIFRLPSQTLRKQITLAPAEIDMLWQSLDAYVPPFYKGKALPLREGIVKVVAFPNMSDGKGGVIPSDRLTYDWKWEYRAQPTLSGYGKSFFKFKNTFLRKQEVVEVFAQVPATGQQAVRKIVIPTYEPKIIFYNTQNPLLPKAINNSFTLRGEGIIRAEPYFLSRNKNNLNNLEFTWKLNNSTIENNNANKPNILRVNATEKGIASIDLSVKNTASSFQNTSGILELEFTD